MVNLAFHVLGIFVVGLGIGATYGADRFPERPVRLIIPFGAGGGTDLVARVVGQELSVLWGHPVVMDNRPGAGGNIGTELTAQAAPDGHTLLVTTAGIVIAPSVYKRLLFDPARDFAAISRLGFSPALALVNPRLQVDSVSELVALAKAQPGKLNFGSSGTGGSGHLATELFLNMAKIKIVHIPYKSITMALADLMGGQVQLVFDAVGTSLPLARSGKLKALAVTTAQRSPFAPDLPTISEGGVAGYDFSYWYGLFAPAKTSPMVVAQLNRDVVKVLEAPATKERLATYAVTATSSSLPQFAAEIRSEIRTWSDVAKSAGIKPE